MIGSRNQCCQIRLLFVNDHINRDRHVPACSEHDRMGKRDNAIVDGLLVLRQSHC
jgi:hypothetical protein